MRKAKRFFLLFVLMAGMAIAQSASKQNGETSNWQKMKECSEQAERFAKLQWTEPSAVSWWNHYSPKHDKCFVESYTPGEKIKSDEKEVKIGGVYTLWDAFEHHMLAMATSFGPESSNWCAIEDEGKPCEQCRAFIEDRMKN
jgi:hypothetical protein